MPVVSTLTSDEETYLKALVEVGRLANQIDTQTKALDANRATWQAQGSTTIKSQSAAQEAAIAKLEADKVTAEATLKGLVW